MDQYKASYSPHQPKMFNSQAVHQGQLDHLQREFLDSTQRKSHTLNFAAGLMAH